MKRILTTFAMIALFAVGLLASAQEVRFESRAIVVNPSPAFGVTVFLDKSGEVPSYRIGEEIRIGVRVDRDAYVYLFSLQPDGSVTQILPNRFSSDNYLRAGETRTYPPSGAGYVFNVDPPTGLSKVVAVASTRELDTRQLARFESGASFATSDIGERGFQSAFSIVVNPVPQSGWVTATTYYEAVRNSSQPQPPSQATLSVDSDPRGAEVYLDGRYQGTTPLRVGSQPGRRTLRLELDGYRAWERTLSLSPGETMRIDADLERIVRDGTLRFESSPSGADVYVDGRYLGTTPLGPRDFSEGGHDVEFRRDGYRTERTSVVVRPGRSDTVRVDLRPILGSLVVQGNVGGAQAFLDGRPVGSLPSGSGRLEIGQLDAGEVEVTVIAPGYSTAVTRVVVRGGETTEIRVRQDRR